MNTNRAIRVRLHPILQIIILVAMTGSTACGSGSDANEGSSAPAQAGTQASPQTTLRASGKANQQPVTQNQRNVIINQTRISDDVVRNLELKYRVQFRDGRYWYDKVSGAWGLEGGPCVGIGVPRLDLAGPLRADASNGQTRIFINGRELHLQDAVGIQTAFGIPPQPGRYWWDAYGNVGYEGGPALFNVRQLLAARGASQGGAWSHHSAYGPTSSGSTVGGDGQGFFYYQDGKTSYTSGN